MKESLTGVPNAQKGNQVSQRSWHLCAHRPTSGSKGYVTKWSQLSLVLFTAPGETCLPREEDTVLAARGVKTPTIQTREGKTGNQVEPTQYSSHQTAAVFPQCRGGRGVALKKRGNFIPQITTPCLQRTRNTKNPSNSSYPLRTQHSGMRTSPYSFLGQSHPHKRWDFPPEEHTRNMAFRMHLSRAHTTSNMASTDPSMTAPPGETVRNRCGTSPWAHRCSLQVPEI